MMLKTSRSSADQN